MTLKRKFVYPIAEKKIQDVVVVSRCVRLIENPRSARRGEQDVILVSWRPPRGLPVQPSVQTPIPQHETATKRKTVTELADDFTV